MSDFKINSVTTSKVILGNNVDETIGVVRRVTWWGQTSQMKSIATFNAAGKIDGFFYQWEENGQPIKTTFWVDGVDKSDLISEEVLNCETPD